MDSLESQYCELLGLYNDLKNEIRRRDKHLYERWKAGGFIIDEDIISMYPNLGKVIDILSPDEESEYEQCCED